VCTGDKFFNTHVIDVSFLLYFVNGNALIVVLSAKVLTGLLFGSGEGCYITEVLKLPILIDVLTYASRSGDRSCDLARSRHVVFTSFAGLYISVYGYDWQVVICGCVMIVWCWQVGVTTDGQGRENLV
jgi:hypothetical protein